MSAALSRRLDLRRALTDLLSSAAPKGAHEEGAKALRESILATLSPHLGDEVFWFSDGVELEEGRPVTRHVLGLRLKDPARFGSASALLTVEGAELAHAEALAIRGASAVLRVKVTSALAPGFTVAAQAIFNERSYRSERRISVSPAGEALALTATLVATDDRGELSVEVLDRAGKPVALAELFATVQDERAAPPSAPPPPPSTRSEPRSPRPRAPPRTAAPTRPRGGRRASGARPSRGAPPTAPRKVRCR